ncbi:MAG: phosphatidylglycerophosphatase A [Phycisphaerales bacterium]|nr:MAG: phosphatidylglycerophosphatase A [Phycisphaerales bacterium]
MAPGTWGSLPPTVAFGLLCHLDAKGVLISAVMAALALAGSAVCVVSAPAVIASSGKNDPREVVADELAGQAVTFLAVPLFGVECFSVGHAWLVAGVGFLLFRVFDIAKPWPIGKLERLPRGWGILADDIAAGICAAMGLLIFVRLLITA